MYRLSISLMILGILFLIIMNVSVLSSIKSENIQVIPVETVVIEEILPPPPIEAPVEVIITKVSTANLDSEIRCLAKNIYFEARSEPTLGQVAVAFVTLNRVESNQFPNTICNVVEQRTRRICQFSWYCESRPHYLYRNDVLTLRDDPVYNRIRDLAMHVYLNQTELKDPTKGSLFYHADYVKKSKIGVRNLVFEARIGRHIFYSI